MNILAFDCAGAQCAAAIAVQSDVVAIKRIEAERGHASLLMPLLMDLLTETGLTFTDMDRFAVTTGPGSFTGIRVALATAQGLALGTGKPVIGVTVFEALAAAKAAEGFDASRLLVAIESRRAECFVQIFDRQARKVTDARMLPPESVAAWAGPGALALAGDAAWRVAPYLQDAGMIETGEAAPIDIAIVARLSETLTFSAPLLPFYLREPDAVKLRDR